MAAAQAAEQKAAAEKAEAERLAAEKAEAERLAAEQKAAEETEPAEVAPLYVVTGAAVVLPLESGSERYLYRGNPIGAGYTKAGIDHALSIGLIERVK